MGENEIAEFLTHLAVERKVSPSTQNQALSALLFLYLKFFERKLGRFEGAERATQRVRVPVVLTPEEAAAVLAHVAAPYRLMAELLYGSGLRLLECLRLRVKEIDFGYSRIVVRDGKGAKDRVTMLPGRLRRPFAGAPEAWAAVHERDVQLGFGRVYLPFALERKYPSAAREWQWQYVFAAPKRAVDPQSGEVRRHHVLEKALQMRSSTRCARPGSKRRPVAIPFDIPSRRIC